MAKCPASDHDARTPFPLNLDGWAHLTCTQCKARLEMKPPRSAVLGSLIAPLFVLARLGRVFEIIAFVFMWLGWAIEPIIQKLPKESLISTLQATREALRARTNSF